MPEMLTLRETDPREVSVYRLLGRLGEGGQGVVYLAEGPDGSPAAVKLLPPTTDPQVRTRFLKEVAAAQRVARFCTAQVLDAGIFERRPFIVSEYVSGPSLIEVVEQLGPRGGAALERIAVATLTALGAVHAAGMVHRDFKPANVLLGPDGPIVIDFGLAAVPGMTTGLSGQYAIGTPAFMAPEQLAGTRVTAAADMWSWAVTIAFAGTGELPFKGDSLTAAAYAILHSEPNVGRLPEPLGSLVRRCLNKNPALRPSARGVLGDLVAAGARLVGPMPPAASPPEKPRSASGDGLIRAGPGSRHRSGRRRSGRARRRRQAAAIAAAAVLVAGAGLLVLNLPRHGASADRLAGRTAPTGQAPTGQAITGEALVRSEAINWIVQQVSRAEIVACDPQVCAGLVAKGIPLADLDTIGNTSTDPLGSNLVVATAAIRAQFGKRLLSVYAPATLASFGSGNAEIDILWIPPAGAKAYHAALPADLSLRKTAGAELLANSQITASPIARTQLLSGDIDPRLVQMLATMAHYHVVSIVDFVNQSPGGGPASLLRSVDLATADPAAHLTRAAYLSWVKSLVNSQTAQYLPAVLKPITLSTGQQVLRIGYAAPSPLS